NIKRERKQMFLNKVKSELNKAEEPNIDGKKDTRQLKKDSSDNSDSKSEDTQLESDSSFSSEEIEEAIEAIVGDSYDSEEVVKLLMSLSSSGVMASTFAHEIKSVSTDLASRNDHFRATIDYILKGKPFSGRPSFNPYTLIDEYEVTDKMLASWLGVMTNPIDREKLNPDKIELVQSIKDIFKVWQPLLDSKFILVDQRFEMEEYFSKNIAEIDLYLIINNFILNSAYFLEKRDENRTIFVKLSLDKNQNLKLELSNNGPKISSKFKNSSDQVFIPGKSSKPKEEGTGLGLWILSEAAIRNGGRASVDEDYIDGFKIDVIFRS
ncbi:ATP-binding protein, partial [Enterococcus sp. 3H8_DIV0648]|uniref:ATP-binding protein n=2 Tax=Enterococcus TaxID=1350 RepID=UPI001C384B91